ncbi:MAG: response regulator [Thermoleophilia bacterium]|nr:response regulator [Thermoleophilia bacterium]
MTSGPARTVRLLIVDNSPTARERLQRLLDPVPDIDVVGEAGSVEKALRLFEDIIPTAVLMDCEMPKPGSFAALNEMMSLYPVPIIMMTKQTPEAGSPLESQALETGAVALVTWTPGSPGKTGDANLLRTVRAMSEVKVVRRRGQLSRATVSAIEATGGSAHVRSTSPAAARAATPTAAATAVAAGPATSRAGASRSAASVQPLLATPVHRVEIVAIGASTGGPPVLQTILSGLSRPLPVPIVIVQHLSRGFQSSLISWLSDATRMRIVVAQHGMPLDAGIVYLAPDDRHMVVDAAGRAMMNSDPPENGSRPSVSVLFRSVSQRYGPHAVGILLTGMGRDGAKELKLMRDKGAATIAQDEETSVVHGMPGEAIKLKGARYILPPERMASVVEHHVMGSMNGVSAASSR